MKVEQARTTARQWVAAKAVALPDVRGALLHGSLGWLEADAELPPGSDVDLLLVVAAGSPPLKTGKMRYRDVILDISTLPDDQVRSPESILGRYHLAGSFRDARGIFFDRSGTLRAVQSVVAREYARRRWVVHRCADARLRVLRHLHSASPADPLPAQVTAWLFGAGVTTHLLLVAGLRNPTVRRRYLATRDLLGEYDQPEIYEWLLEMLGCGDLTAPRVAHHLEHLAAAFNDAAAVIRTPFFFASDISPLARPIAIDGSRALISQGDHCEAVFWLVATWARCQMVLAHDAPPEVHERHAVGFRELLADLGIASAADLRWRSAQVEASLPQVWAAAEAIIAANPAIDTG